jgi:hypothetical protein
MVQQPEEKQYNSAQIHSWINQESVDKSRGKNILKFVSSNTTSPQRELCRKK